MTRMKKILISYKKGVTPKDNVNHPTHYTFKNGLEDLYKAQWYLNELIKHEEEKAKNQKKD